MKKGGFSMIEILFAVSILAIILTALMGAMLYTVNTLSEARYRANAIAWASSCLDDFKKARAGGWVQFAEHAFQYVSCDGARFGTGMATKIIKNQITDEAGVSRTTDAGGTYCLRISGDTSGRSGDDGHIKVTVQVGWTHFNDRIGCNDFDALAKNRTATVEQVFYRYNDEQAI